MKIRKFQIILKFIKIIKKMKIILLFKTIKKISSTVVNYQMQLKIQIIS